MLVSQTVVATSKGNGSPGASHRFGSFLYAVCVSCLGLVRLRPSCGFLRYLLLIGIWREA
jgi:hypothetical protein